MKCDVCNNELDNYYCSTNVCKKCCESGKCPIKYKCKAYTKILEKKWQTINKELLEKQVEQEQLKERLELKKIKIKFNPDDFPDYCEDCNRSWGDVIDDETYDKEIEKERKYQKKYKKGIDENFEKNLFNAFDGDGRHQLNLYIQKESSEYTVATLINLREKLRNKNIMNMKKRE